MRKCTVKATEWSGSKKSMWNKNRWKTYSRIVHTILPRKNAGTAYADAIGAMRPATSALRGAAGSTVKGGREYGPRENWTKERMKMYVAMGSQTVGTTYHAVRVKIYGAYEHNIYENTHVDVPQGTKVQTDVETPPGDEAGGLAAGSKTWRSWPSKPA